MTTDYAMGPAPWCTICGYHGEAEYIGLQAERPIGRCQRGAPKAKGCGRVILTTSAVEAGRVADSYRRRVTAAHHWQHSPEQGGHPWCEHCIAAGWRLRELTNVHR